MSIVVLTVALHLVVRPASGLAQTQTVCTYEPRTVSVQLVGEPATLSVGAQGEVLVNGRTCPDLTADDASGEIATVGETGAIDVTGTDAADLVVIDQTGPGGPFPSVISFPLDLKLDAGDALHVVGTAGEDHITALASTLHLDGDTGGGDVQLSGVDRVEVDAGTGNDEVDASLSDIDSPDFSTPITILGGDGTDTLTGGVGNDRLYGQGDGDVLDGNEGTDVLNGGAEEGDLCWYGAEFLSCDPSIELTPSEGPADSAVIASGAGWYPENGVVSIAFAEQEPSAAPTPLPDGSFSVDVDVPTGPDGSATVAACQQCLDGVEPVVDTTQFIYTAQPSELTLDVSPDPAPMGGSILVSGSGWYADEPVSLLVDPADGALGDVPTPPADPNGLFVATVELGVLDVGDYRIVACQRCDTDQERSLEAVFRIEAIEGISTIQVQPDSAQVGDMIDVIGAGWRADLGRVHLFIGSPAMEDREVDVLRAEGGAFETSFIVPDLPPGSYTVTACQQCSSSRERVDATEVVEVVAVEPAPSALVPWIVGGAALLLLLATIAFFLRRKPPTLKREGEHLRPPEARVHARARPSAPEMIVSREPDGTSDHRIRLVPRPDRGSQRVEEMSSR